MKNFQQLAAHQNPSKQIEVERAVVAPSQAK